jgi:SAM-dependent methyltransferase
MKPFDPNARYLGGYHPLDGTLEFFGRLHNVLRPTDTVIDVGAGRGAWYFEDRCSARRAVRDIKPHVKTYIGVDIDPVVMTNPTTTENIVMDGTLPLPALSADVVLADYVLEHVLDPQGFFAEVNRVLKPGGYFFARTPCKYQYVALLSRAIPNRHHTAVLRSAQPDRKAQDVFPTGYRMNSLREIRRIFRNYQDYSYLYSPEPSYYFGGPLAYGILSALHRLLPKTLVSNLFVILRKR